MPQPWRYSAARGQPLSPVVIPAGDSGAAWLAGTAPSDPGVLKKLTLTTTCQESQIIKNLPFLMAPTTERRAKKADAKRIHSIRAESWCGGEYLQCISPGHTREFADKFYAKLSYLDETRVLEIETSEGPQIVACFVVRPLDEGRSTGGNSVEWMEKSEVQRFKTFNNSVDHQLAP